MHLFDISQLLINRKKLKKYVEIGVYNGRTFFRIKSNFKIAIDPDFKFGRRRKTGKLIVNPSNRFNQYFEKTSDNFFKEDAPRLFSKDKIELGLVDGMHEYGYALRDIENMVQYMAGEAVIVVHDCNPQTKAAGSPFEEYKARNYKGVWNGDVWKSILHIRSMRNDLRVFVLDCDHGIGIITKGNPGQMLSFTKEEINSLQYEDFDANRHEWLNLKPENYFYDFLELKQGVNVTIDK